VDYSAPLTFGNSQVALALFSDDSPDADLYRLNYVDVSIYKED
jgi:hypothetical protein